MKNCKLLIVLLFFVCCILANAQIKTAGTTYRNPVIAGDFPDPTIIRVDKNYYAAGTSSDFAPHYPLYHSVDLINWERIGFCLMETPKWASGSFWAPELFYNNGVYYLYYTAKRKTDNVSCIGVATTTDIHRGFTDKSILIDWGKEAIDAFVFKDTDGKLYICWKAYGLNKDRPIEILASELSTDGLKLIGDHFSLTRYDEGWVGNGDEGPCLVKKNGYYYLFYSVGGCCDNQCSYQVMVSRSKNLKKGWKQYDQNPVLEGNTDWKCSGHGTIVETPDQRSFFLYHAYNSKDFEYVGRQGMLDEVIWDKQTGWPHFRNGKSPSSIAALPFRNTVQLRDSTYTDHFINDHNLFLWQWDLKSQKPVIKIEGGKLMLSSTKKGIVFTGLSPQTGTFSLEAKIECSEDMSGICLYGSPENLIGFVANRTKISLFRIIKGQREVIFETPNTGHKELSLKLEAKNGRYYEFFISDNHVDWKNVPLINKYLDGAFLPQWGVGLRTGLLLDNQLDKPAVFSFVRLNNTFN